MNSKIIFFGLGVLVGVVSSFTYAKKKYERIATDEINSVRKYYHKRKRDAENENEQKPKDYLYEDAIKAVSEYSGSIKKEEEMNNNNVSIISPDDFGEEYETITLYCYDDGTITDFYDKKITDPERILGDINPKEHFGEYEDDSVFVRNDSIKLDIEVLSTCGDYEEEDG